MLHERLVDRALLLRRQADIARLRVLPRDESAPELAELKRSSADVEANVKKIASFFEKQTVNPS